MSDLYYDTLPPDISLGQIHTGVIHEAPTSSAGYLSVIIPGIHPDLQFDNCMWQARDNMTPPQAGDICLVVFENNNVPWVVAWWPASRSPQIFTGPSAPPSPVDQDIWFAQNADNAGNIWLYQYSAASSSWVHILAPGLVIPDTSWHIIGNSGQIPFTNGFANWDGAQGTGRAPRYRKTASNLVIFSGVIRTPASGSTTISAFTMPAGYRPVNPYNVNIPLYSNLTTCYGNVLWDGTTTFVLANSTAIPNNTWIYLEGFTYYAEA